MDADESPIVFPQALRDRVMTAIELLTGRELRLAVAESCTGGALAAALTAISGASRCFDGGVVAYSNAAKTALLDVAPEALETQGAVSDVVAGQMASGALTRFGSDLAISTTGIAGPGGATADKPAGLVFIALAAPAEVRVSRCLFTGPRASVQSRATREALDMLLDYLKETQQQEER